MKKISLRKVTVSIVNMMSHIRIENIFRKAIICAVITSAMCLCANRLAAQDLSSDYKQWHAGVSAGITIEGIKEIPNIFGLHGAYFFNHIYGAGLVARKSNVYGSEDLFCGAAFFAHWGRYNSKLFFPTRIGLGINQHTYRRAQLYYITNNFLGGYASVGIAIRPSKLVSFGINAEFASAFDYIDVEYLGFNFCVSFHF